MRHIAASEAKTHFLRLIVEVEHGEEIVVTHRGRPVIRMVPEPARQRALIDAAVDRIEKLRRQTQPVTVEELLTARNEGRR
jgi:prevent-host-death family protein